MKKYLFYIVIAMSFLCAPSVLAETKVRGIVVGADNLFGKNPNTTVTSCAHPTSEDKTKFADNKVHCLDTNDIVEILNYSSPVASTTSTCKKGYYYANSVSFPGDGKDHFGYICADNVVTEINVSEELKNEFRNAGFPESYWAKLSLLKAAHPNWKFKAYNTNIDFTEATLNEEGASAIQSSDPKYLSLNTDYSYNSDGTYNQLPEANGWYYANPKTIAYYMDPRNFLDEKSIFMFESLGFDSELQTLEAVHKVLAGTELDQYADLFYEAATYKNNNISPVYLASLSKQEVLKDGKLSPSASGVNSYQNGIYNFYNIGANSSCTNAVKCGIEWAMNTNAPEELRFDRAWTSPRLAILGGATKIAYSFIKNGQVNTYLKKFNVTPNYTYSNQYQTNIKAPYSEAQSTAKGYIDSGKFDSAFEFVIPVFKNMPSDAATLPSKVEEVKQPEKEEPKVEDDTLSVINNAGYSINGSYIMGVQPNTTAQSMKAKIGHGVVITCDGVSIDGDHLVGTADILKINNHSYRVIVKGDATGDGIVSPADYMAIKDHIMEKSTLKNVFQVSGDMNNDGTISPSDYKIVKDDIMNR